MARYSVLLHEVPPDSGRKDHFDLLLENGEVLTTWELSSWPPASSQPVSRLADHRLDYLEFEGPLTGNRGSVRRVSDGVYKVLSKSERQWLIELCGKDFAGNLQFRLSDNSQKDSSNQCWILSPAPATE